MKKIVAKAEMLFRNWLKKIGYDPYGLLNHLQEMEKWAGFMCKNYPKADREIIMLAVWLHDLGHYPLPTKIDHAVRSERLARKFLNDEKYPTDKAEKVLHCIRAHRCKDVMPKTLEAKIIASIDSASHLTDDVYIGMARDDKNLKRPFRAYGKMERDFRDISVFPEIKKILTPLYKAWKKTIIEYEKLNYENQS